MALKRKTESETAQRRGLSLADRIEDEFRFIRTFAASPLKLGSVTPTSRALAELMVRHAHPDPGGYTLEIGPGTGVVTEALIEAGIPPERIVSLEYEEGFCRHLRKRFPRVNVLHGDALDLSNALGEFRDLTFSAGLSGIPLLNLPKAKRLPYLESVLDRLRPGGIVTQLSYSLIPPQEAVPGRLVVDKSKWVTLNLPPGRAWIYRRPGFRS
jgi:phosphatidylethanolamine/phosphatidyl-N-methylethanolamine N-methyltransferase